MKRSPSGLAPVIALDRKSSQPLHRQIYEAYRTAIVEGRLRPGQRIPSTRVLCAELGVSRFPVLNAYAQLLAEGYFTSRVGAGTVVSTSLPDHYHASAPARMRLASDHSSPRPVSSRSALPPSFHDSPWLLGWGPFGVGQVAVDHLPLNIWSTLVARRSRSMDLRSFHYGDQMGSLALRRTIANYLNTSRSLRCEAEQIMILSGSQHALELCARVLLDPGNAVWIEDPGYILARQVFAWAGARLVPVPVDEEGLNVSAGIKRCRKARLAYVTPSHQFPLGYTMSAARRMQLLEWAQHTGAWILEDDYDSEYRYESPPISSVQGIDADARVLYIGTFSKVLFPALRIGYLVIPTDLVERFLRVRRLMDLGSPTFYQEVLADFISEGHFARHIRRMRTLYHERRDTLVESIRQEFGSRLEVLGSEAGMHLAILLPPGSRDREIALSAAKQSVWMWPLSSSYAAEAPRPGLILGFGSAPANEIPGAVRKFRDLLTK